MKKFFVLLSVLCLLLSACGSQPAQPTRDQTEPTGQQPQVSAKTVGISLPDGEISRWQTEGAALTEKLESAGLEVLVEYAEGDPMLQAEQIGQMIDRKVACLVVAAVDSLLLTQTLSYAQSAGIPVIAYDHLLMNTNAVSCCVAPDSRAMGVSLGQYIVLARQLETAQAEGRSYTIEFFMGSPEDNNSVLLHQGLMEVLDPYLQIGVLMCRSGRVSFEDTCIQGSSEALARQECENYLTGIYATESLNICCTAADELAGGCVAALEAAGCTAENWPLLTGTGASLPAARRIASGQQTVTMLTDTRYLVDTCAQMAQKAVEGNLPEQQTTLDNGVMSVPAYLGAAVSVDGENYRQVLIDGGVFTQEEITQNDGSGR